MNEGSFADRSEPRLSSTRLSVKLHTGLSGATVPKSEYKLTRHPIARGEMAADTGELLLFVGGDKQLLDGLTPILSHLGNVAEFLVRSVWASREGC